MRGAQLLRTAVSVVVFAALCQFLAYADDFVQSNGRVVQLSGSQIQLAQAGSDWTSDYDYLDHMQGPIYYNDCVIFINRSKIAATHIQFMFAAVDLDGEVKRPLLPLDVHYTAEAGKTYDGIVNCRQHGYANGDRGLWLVAWVNRVDFADGTSWSAPPESQLTEQIRKALPRASTF